MSISSNIFKCSVIIQSLLWIVFSFIYFFKDDTIFLICLLMLINGIFFFLSALFFNKGKLLQIFIFVFIAVNLILSLTDQTGFFDYLVFVFDIISLISLVIFVLVNKNKI